MTPPDPIRRLSRLLAATLCLMAFASNLNAEAAAAGPRHYATPEEAVGALVAAAKSGDRDLVYAILGPEVKDILSGDPKQDALEFTAFAKSLGQYAHLAKSADDRYVLDIGAQNWPMPIPLVRKGGFWFFDTAAGKDEILSRRIGEDEITAIGVCRTYVQAQREYASEDHDGSGILQFASKIKSTAGKKDGLYWPAAPGEEQSPFGPLVAEARAEGYGPKGDAGKPQPFHGYRFRILTAQGSSAPGGAFSYVINGNMIAGFALVAYPAHWGESGVMTFIVNQWGRVYERNLGEKSAEVAGEMSEFDPDSGWTPVAQP